MAIAGEFEYRAKLGDFGVSNVLHLSRGERGVRDAACGTLAFMPPEMLEHPRVVSTKVDVWSFGVLLWELWTRQVPFAGLTNHELIHRIQNGRLLEWPDKTPAFLTKLSARCWRAVRSDLCCVHTQFPSFTGTLELDWIRHNASPC